MGEGYWARYESVVDQRIREAQERGAFDDLPGAGKPLVGLHGPDDENWWIRSYLEREGLPTDALLPPPLRLRKERERLPETVRDLETEAEVRRAVREYNQRVAAYVRHPTGPRVSVRPASVDEVVAGWRAASSRGTHRSSGPRGSGSASSTDGGDPRAGEAHEADVADVTEVAEAGRPRARERHRRWLRFRWRAR